MFINAQYAVDLLIILFKPIDALVPRQALAARKVATTRSEETQVYDATQVAEGCQNGIWPIGAGSSPVAAPSAPNGVDEVSRSLARDCSSAALEEISGIEIAWPCGVLLQHEFTSYHDRDPVI